MNAEQDEVGSRIAPFRAAYAAPVVLFAEAVYEVMPVYARRPFRFVAHCERLTASLGQLGMQDPHTRAQWHEIIAALIERNAEHNSAQHCYVYWQVTRGVEYGRNHTPLPKIERAIRCGARVPASNGQTTPQSTPASSQPTTEIPASA